MATDFVAVAQPRKLIIRWYSLIDNAEKFRKFKRVDWILHSKHLSLNMRKLILKSYLFK